MLRDAHIHMGYYSRKGCDVPYYYSPRKIAGILNRCNIDRFIVSSTSAQMDGITFGGLRHEAEEMMKRTKGKASIFLWVSGLLYEKKAICKEFESGLYTGIKLHENEGCWLRERNKDLMQILTIASDYRLPVMFHSGKSEEASPVQLARIAEKFPQVNFNFAHCNQMDEMARVVAGCENVWTDTAYLPFEEFERLNDFDWRDRLMFGTDLPVWQAYSDVSLTKNYRRYCNRMRVVKSDSVNAFNSYLNHRTK